MTGPQTRIQLCGKLVARIEGRDVAPALPAAQGRILFAFLVCERTRGADRDELVEAVWGESPPAAAGQGIRTLLSKLRRAIGEERVSAGPEGVRLVLPAGAWVDSEAAVAALHEAESAVARERWAPAWASAHIAINASTRRFMAGHEADWIEERRQALAGVRLSALEALAAAGLGLGGGELDTAERAARSVVAAAPFRESATVCLMRVLAAQGNPAEALIEYERLRVRLRDELGTVPSALVQDVHAQVLSPQS